MGAIFISQLRSWYSPDARLQRTFICQLEIHYIYLCCDITNICCIIASLLVVVCSVDTYIKITSPIFFPWCYDHTSSNSLDLLRLRSPILQFLSISSNVALPACCWSALLLVSIVCPFIVFLDILVSLIYSICPPHLICCSLM